MKRASLQILWILSLGSVLPAILAIFIVSNVATNDFTVQAIVIEKYQTPAKGGVVGGKVPVAWMIPASMNLKVKAETKSHIINVTESEYSRVYDGQVIDLQCNCKSLLGVVLSEACYLVR